MQQIQIYYSWFKLYEIRILQNKVHQKTTKIPVTIGIWYLSIYIPCNGIAIKEVRTKKKVAFKNLSSIEKNIE